MKKITTITAMALGMMAAIMACNNQSGSKSNTAGVLDSAARVSRGEYLVNAIGCDDCHSPKKLGPMGPEVIPELRLSGFPHNGQLPRVDTMTVKSGWVLFGPDFTNAVGEWGASFAANLTSDETGIGNWKEEQFLTAIKKGKYKGLEGSRDLLPPMPWFNYRNLSDEDLKSIFAYLKTVPPVDNVPPTPKALSEFK